ncbi:MAG: bifunctional folylpolyglutamate synthase/dihydrofolate synthase [Hyphomonadaceae bacterium]|nr:bifunctional folylpolyglutamate synthase/dihydrofolate synthase [Clostridia bacterium]
MQYEQVIQYIESPHVNMSKLGLTNTLNLLDRLGNPHKKMQFIHIAGTNGKGSTAAMATSILMSAGFKVGLYTSPYLIDFTEKIQINRMPIEQEKLAQLGTEIIDIIGEMVADGENHPTMFEITTALAMLYFYRENCDIVVLEVGLGGRFDATNVIDKPLVSVITNIGLDHMDILGDTIPKIAFEKCGIIKPNGCVVAYPALSHDALDVIENICYERQASLLQASMPTVINHSSRGTVFHYKQYKNLLVSLLGEHQSLNAVTAMEAVLATNFSISEQHIREGLKNSHWMGRFEVFGQNQNIIIDGAHNEQGIDTLLKNLHVYYPNKKITFMMGMLKDKAYASCIQKTASIAKGVMITEVPNEKTASGEEMAQIAKQFCKNVFLNTSYQLALKTALNQISEDEILCICGSLYLIGPIRHELSTDSAIFDKTS